MSVPSTKPIHRLRFLRAAWMTLADSMHELVQERRRFVNGTGSEHVYRGDVFTRAVETLDSDAKVGLEESEAVRAFFSAEYLSNICPRRDRSVISTASCSLVQVRPKIRDCNDTVQPLLQRLRHMQCQQPLLCLPYIRKSNPKHTWKSFKHFPLTPK